MVADLVYMLLFQVIAKRTEESGKVKVLLHWTPEEMWVNNNNKHLANNGWNKDFFGIPFRTKKLNLYSKYYR